MRLSFSMSAFRKKHTYAVRMMLIAPASRRAARRSRSQFSEPLSEKRTAAPGRPQDCFFSASCNGSEPPPEDVPCFVCCTYSQCFCLPLYGFSSRQTFLLTIRLSVFPVAISMNRTNRDTLLSSFRLFQTRSVKESISPFMSTHSGSPSKLGSGLPSPI